MNNSPYPYSPYQTSAYGHAQAQSFQGAPSSAPAAWAKWVYLGAAFLAVMGFAVGIALIVIGADRSSSSWSYDVLDVLAGLGLAVFGGSFLFFTVKFVMRLVWLHGC